MYERGTIPGSINLPFTVFGQDDNALEFIEVMEKIGARRRSGQEGSMLDKLFGSKPANEVWDFSDVKQLVFWCNGLWCGQSPTSIKDLLKHGFPPEKIFYYRGGMQAWQILGLITVQ